MARRPSRARVLLSLALLASWPAAATADDARGLLRDYSMTMSGFVEAGETDYSAFRSDYAIAPRATGIRYSERNGVITGTLGLIVSLAMRAVGKSSNVKGTRTWHEDGYRYHETTFYSEEEKAERRERAAQAGGAQAGMLAGSTTQGFDLWIYSRNLGGDTTGWKAQLMLFSLFESESARLDVGLVFGSISTATARDGLFLLTHAPTGGIPLRYNRAFGPILTYAQFDLNFYGLGTLDPAKDVTAQGTTLAQDVRNLPWRVGASAAILHRIYVDVAVTTPRLLSGAFGVSTSLGARF